MLDENADKTLIRTKNSTVEHHRAVLFTILADIAGIQSLGQYAVGLNGAHLPGAANGIGQVPLKFGA